MWICMLILVINLLLCSKVGAGLSRDGHALSNFLEETKRSLDYGMSNYADDKLAIWNGLTLLDFSGTAFVNQTDKIPSLEGLPGVVTLSAAQNEVEGVFAEEVHNVSKITSLNLSNDFPDFSNDTPDLEGLTFTNLSHLAGLTFTNLSHFLRLTVIPYTDYSHVGPVMCVSYSDLSAGPNPDDLPPGIPFHTASLLSDNSGPCGGPLTRTRVWQFVTIVFCTGSCLLLVWILWRWSVHFKQHQQDADLIATLLARETVTVMPLRKLRRATSNFSESAQIGVGGFGRVYYGQLADGTAVAIKKSKNEGSLEYKQQFLNEVKILSGVNHRHLVKLLGCSMENKIALLVFEFVPNGTLQEHLQGKIEGFSPLSWRQRLLIALQTCDALAYLHSAADPPIFHRDVKSSNILLDDELNAKVADFGISKLAPSKAATHVSTVAIQGTMGYIDPEYYVSFKLTPRSDVYSFGVVLLELISAKPAVDFQRGDDKASLVNLALSAMETGEFEELMDPVLGDTYGLANGKASMDSVAALAVRCLAFRSRERPAMREFWNELQTAWLDWDSDSSFQSDHVRHSLQPQNAYCDVRASYSQCLSPQSPYYSSMCSSSSTSGSVEIEMQPYP